jgi:hypothetical protein
VVGTRRGTAHLRIVLYRIRKLGPSAPIKAPPHPATSRRASAKTSSTSSVGSPARIACKHSRASAAQRRSRSASRPLSQSRNVACSSGVNCMIASWISAIPLTNPMLRLPRGRFKRTEVSSKPAPLGLVPIFLVPTKPQAVTFHASAPHFDFQVVWMSSAVNDV